MSPRQNAAAAYGPPSSHKKFAMKLKPTSTITRIAFVALALAALTQPLAAADLSDRYLLVNLHPSEVDDETFARIAELAVQRTAHGPQLGVGGIISYLRHPPQQSLDALQRLLALSQEHGLPVIVQLDGEQWWQDRPDLWNWWDPSRPGYDPANAANVEWFGWGQQHALKIAWRNWGRQLRVLPPPNLMSQRYRAACHEAMRPLLAEIVRWRSALPPEEAHLLVGVKVGWESAIGMGSHYYPGGNDLLDKDPTLDPVQRAQADELPGRGFQPIGYAAVTTAGLASGGELREDHLAEVVRRHLDDLAAAVRAAGLPREQIFTHAGGWKEGELLYAAAVNEHSCPGWSFYSHARDPQGDRTAMAALATSDAPYWGAVEWLPVGAGTAEAWESAIRTTLAADRCRYLCAYNWRKIADNQPALAAIRAALTANQR